MKMTKLDQSKEPDCSNNWVSPVGWLLANIINLATPNKNDSLGTGWFAQGINVALYVRVAVVVAENLLPMLESVKHTKKNCGYLGNAEMFIEATDPDILESEVNGVSLKISYLDLFRPVHQQWHLSTLLATIKTDVLVPILGDLGKFELLDVAYYYSYMLRILSSLNPGNGPSPILNMLSYTPGFLFSLFGVLESIIGYPTNDNKPCRSGTSKGEYDKSFEKKQRKTLRDSGIKWANLLQKITGKLPTNINITDTTDSEHRLYGSNNVEEDSSKLWDIELFKRGPQGVSKDVACLLHLFCEAYTHLLLILDDIEFYEKQVPFSLEQQRRITSVLNTLVYNGVSHNNNNNGPQHKPLMDASVKCLHLLYERDCRRQFCPPSLWLSPARKCRPPIAAAARAHEAIFASSTKAGDLVTILSMSSIVTITPHIFPFNERVQMFREFIKLEKVSRRMAGEGVGLGPGSIEIVVRRGHIVEDGFKQLNNLGSRLKSKIHVSFVSESGLPEAGLDYGGLSKEFLTDISKAAFDPNYGLFSQTSTSERLLMPNTSARLLDNGMQMIEFLGRVVGKGLYEGILLDYSFSRVFIQKLLGRYSFLDELSTLDPELYRNLMYLKHYDGDVQDLTLDFTVTEELLGKRVVTELKPGGKDVSVTNENKLHYLHAVADYKLNKQVLPLANAFYRGLSDIILPSWLSLFNPNEFNQLLSGGNHDMDVDDLRSNTRYTGGYSAESRTIKIFWELSFGAIKYSTMSLQVIIGFEPEERCMLLKFVTSCSRAPLLGFKHLQPTFTIHKVTCDAPLWATIGGQDVDRLPSASTCYNTLKLPTYKRSSTLRSKLLYAISSNAGFELS
ncbi:hypothetical protein GIB67_021325 [Kingdonia uniflora]|uniref:HECT-type E3 ubiquitin transferase n=1 Tax=Kingdonia uniflora TaxID=39325 RepID=A0A7J7LY19_9MAGN|nr:hypothetical protein GIB67_021325 [Kingdonia uniflora]